MKSVLVIFFVVCFGFVGKTQDNTFTDPRDNQVYKTVQVGDKLWMAQNLNFDDEGAKCYKEKAANCETYGKLYYSKQSQKVCPSGWHLPSKQEVEDFMKASTGKESFFTYNGLTSIPLYLFTNLSALNIQYGGYMTLSGKFENIEKIVYFWTSDEIGQNQFSKFYFDQKEEKFTLNSTGFTAAFYCHVRCVKD